LSVFLVASSPPTRYKGCRGVPRSSHRLPCGVFSSFRTFDVNRQLPTTTAQQQQQPRQRLPTPVHRPSPATTTPATCRLPSLPSYYLLPARSPARRPVIVWTPATLRLSAHQSVRRHNRPSVCQSAPRPWLIIVLVFSLVFLNYTFPKGI
jgi:hypothetical protein